jgi:heme/copper-type cytochrome/quinol oxidase subunit 4
VHAVQGRKENSSMLNHVRAVVLAVVFTALATWVEFDNDGALVG